MSFKFGSHMSVAGGVHLAIESAAKLSMNCCQIFTKNASQWNCKPITDELIECFTKAKDETKIHDVFSHASYLINLATPDDTLWNKSIDALAIELQRADQLGLHGVVVHPGAFVKSDEATGIERIIEALKIILQRLPKLKTKLLLENTAGQGTTLGWNMAQLAAMLQGVGKSKQLGLCIDTCHAHAAGYDLSTATGLRKLIDELKHYKLVSRTELIHMNDSKKEAGSRVDRHEHLGIGTIGIGTPTTGGLAAFIHSPEFANLPMVLETAKGTTDAGEDWDAVNLAVLNDIAAKKIS